MSYSTSPDAQYIVGKGERVEKQRNFRPGELREKGGFNEDQVLVRSRHFAKNPGSPSRGRRIGVVLTTRKSDHKGEKDRKEKRRSSGKKKGGQYRG